MSRVFNFSAGPATMPEPVLKRMQSELVDYRGQGQSLLEMSHRSATYDEVHRQAIDGIRSLLGLGEHHEVLLLAGGATLQFGMVPLNLLGSGGSCDLVLSGSWAKKAKADAAAVGSVRVAWDGSDTRFTTLPDPAEIEVSSAARYLHLTSNETIEGIQWQEFPSVDCPIVADMSSDILSRPVPVDRFGLIYAGAQKNLGPAGVTVVVIRKDLLGQAPDSVPAYLRYETHAEKNSLYNTPPVYAVWALALVTEWIAEQGGLAAIAEVNERKAAALYEAIDTSDGFYTAPADRAVRSRMNVVFRLPDESSEKRFIAGAAERGLVALKGHRSVGGVRASIYNAMSEQGVQALIDYMHEFRS